MPAAARRHGGRLLLGAALAVPLLVIAGLVRHTVFTAICPVWARGTPRRAPAVARLAQPPMAAPDGAETSDSGLAWEVIKLGSQSGLTPQMTSDVVVHYKAWKVSTGEKFDDSYMSGQPACFKLTSVIPGWTEGVGMMREGEKRRFWIPAKLAYGLADPSGKEEPGPPKGDLVYEMELLKVTNEGTDSIFSFFGGLAAFLAVITVAYTLTSEPAERAEYETGPALIGFKPGRG